MRVLWLSAAPTVLAIAAALLGLFLAVLQHGALTIINTDAGDETVRAGNVNIS